MYWDNRSFYIEQKYSRRRDGFIAAIMYAKLTLVGTSTHDVSTGTVIRLLIVLTACVTAFLLEHSDFSINDSQSLPPSRSLATSAALAHPSTPQISNSSNYFSQPIFTHLSVVPFPNQNMACRCLGSAGLWENVFRLGLGYFRRMILLRAECSLQGSLCPRKLPKHQFVDEGMKSGAVLSSIGNL